MSFPLRLTVGGAAVAAAAVILVQAERPPMDSIQRGYRGTGMEQIYNPRIVADFMIAFPLFLEKWVGFKALMKNVIGVDDHGAKLPDAEGFAVTAYAPLTIKNGHGRRKSDSSTQDR